MQFRRLLIPLTLVTCTYAKAQNTSPYWSLAGNNNASNTTSKLGTTNAIDLRLFTNNVERIRILSSNGNIGIGTVAPTDRLHLNTPSGTNALRVQVNGSTKLLVHSGGGVAIGANQTPPVNGLFVSGNVGIGTNAPSSGYKLHVVGKGLFTTGLRVEAGGFTTINTAGNGLEAIGNGTSGYGVAGNGHTGVYGNGSSYGVYGLSYNGTGVYGEGNGRGVSGRSQDGEGIYGSSYTGIGVSGYSSNVGVLGESTHIGVYGSGTAYAGYFLGDVFTSGSYLPSASKLKENIRDMSSAMLLLSKLHPKEYVYKQEGAYGLMNLPKGRRYGLIAEEVEQVLPGLVKETKFDSHMVQKHVRGTPTGQQTSSATEAIDFKAVNYTELIPIMVKGLQELSEKDAELVKKVEEIAELRNELAELRQMVLELKQGKRSNPTLTSAALEQNIPNPVNGSTTIRYNVPEASTAARLTITNAKGQAVKTMTLTNRGTGQVNLNTQGLASGTYNYTLYVDGKATDTKRLVIAR